MGLGFESLTPHHLKLRSNFSDLIIESIERLIFYLLLNIFAISITIIPITAIYVGNIPIITERKPSPPPLIYPEIMAYNPIPPTIANAISPFWEVSFILVLCVLFLLFLFGMISLFRIFYHFPLYILLQ